MRFCKLGEAIVDQVRLLCEVFLCGQGSLKCRARSNKKPRWSSHAVTQLYQCTPKLQKTNASCFHRWFICLQPYFTCPSRDSALTIRDEGFLLLFCCVYPEACVGAKRRPLFFNTFALFPSLLPRPSFLPLFINRRVVGLDTMALSSHSMFV